MYMTTKIKKRNVRLRADDREPALPAPDADGNYPAVAAIRVSLARDIIRHRRRVGLTQAELARRAGIRPETLNRIEQGKNSPTIATVDRIDKVLKKAEEELGEPVPGLVTQDDVRKLREAGRQLDWCKERIGSKAVRTHVARALELVKELLQAHDMVLGNGPRAPTARGK
jgi:HTH-type transcriptional regulator/antitoxin HipB